MSQVARTTKKFLKKMLVTHHKNLKKRKQLLEWRKYPEKHGYQRKY